MNHSLCLMSSHQLLLLIGGRLLRPRTLLDCLLPKSQTWVSIQGWYHLALLRLFQPRSFFHLRNHLHIAFILVERLILLLVWSFLLWSLLEPVLLWLFTTRILAWIWIALPLRLPFVPLDLVYARFVVWGCPFERWLDGFVNMTWVSLWRILVLAWFF